MYLFNSSTHPDFSLFSGNAGSPVYTVRSVSFFGGCLKNLFPAHKSHKL